MHFYVLKKAYKIPVKDIQETKNGCLERREMGDMGHRWNKDLPLWILWYELIFELCEYITYSENKNITNGVLPFIFNENCWIQFQWIFLILFQWVFPKPYNRWRKPNQSYKTSAGRNCRNCTQTGSFQTMFQGPHEGNEAAGRGGWSLLVRGGSSLTHSVD